MTRFYANENFHYPAVEELQKLGHDVLTMQEMGKAGKAESDKAVLAFASAENRAVLTLNRMHFIHLHQENPIHKGIIVCTFDPNFSALANRIHRAVAAFSDLSGQLIRINRPHVSSGNES